jgi:hypothetical protein
MDLIQKMSKIGVNHLALDRLDNVRVIPFNRAKNAFRSKYAEIANYLSAYPGENFRLIGKKEVKGTALVDEYVTHELISGLSEPNQSSEAIMNETIEIEKLKLKIESLQATIDDNELYIAELEQKLEQYMEEEGSLQQGQPPIWLETLLKVGGALAEKYLDQRSEMFNIQKAKLNGHSEGTE